MKKITVIGIVLLLLGGLASLGEKETVSSSPTCETIGEKNGPFTLNAWASSVKTEKGQIKVTFICEGRTLEMLLPPSQGSMVQPGNSYSINGNYDGFTLKIKKVDPIHLPAPAISTTENIVVTQEQYFVEGNFVMISGYGPFKKEENQKVPKIKKGQTLIIEITKFTDPPQIVSFKTSVQ